MRAKIEELLGLFRGFLGGFPDEPVAGSRALAATAGERRELEPNSLSCLRHLDRAVEIAPEPARPLAMWLAANRDSLRWGQTYTGADFGRDFIDNYGWVELIGTRGHFASDELAAGFLILGPGILYPDHHHVAEEVYIPLTGGTDWRKGEGAFTRREACEVIHHPSNINHAMRTSAEPLLALYLWRGGPLAQKSVIGR
ncbi:MAG TPA: dimethylsulfonioproprionate lyase family protein [Rhizobiaceae bacterium]|nr:dimethylsulfonioproprionate lyase family protein [Rhizobiaceae bacterium]